MVLFVFNDKVGIKNPLKTIFMAGTVQNGLIYLYELISTDGLNNHTLDGILRSSFM